ncbi:MAG: hypothetical protein HQM03_12760 [Magnetococcales bacterium]|nr:hypothetical protein [Magnetococcales bacterium]
MSALFRSLRLLVVVAPLFAFTQAGWAAVDHEQHGEAGKSPARLTLNQGKPWATDLPLRKGMELIQRDIQEALPRIHSGTQKPKQYADLANKVHGHVNKLIKECKLPPEADAQLHIVLGEMIQGAVAMQDSVLQASGAAKVVHALDLYGRHFDHPGWTPIPIK